MPKCAALGATTTSSSSALHTESCVEVLLVLVYLLPQRFTIAAIDCRTTGTKTTLVAWHKDHCAPNFSFQLVLGLKRRLDSTTTTSTLFS